MDDFVLIATVLAALAGAAGIAAAILAPPYLLWRSTRRQPEMMRGRCPPTSR